jgi:hypothetical protein
MVAARTTLISHCAVLALLLNPGFAGAANPAWVFPQMSRPGEIDAGDCKRTLQCRQVLLADPTLASLNIGVSARSGVITLWGLVPSKDLSLRAEKCLQHVPGVLEIRNDLRVGVPGAAHDELLSNPERHQALTRVEPPPPARLTSRAEEPGAGALMPAIAVPTAQSQPMTAQPAQPVESPWLIQRVDRLRQQDRRFENVRPTIVGGVVRLSGGVYFKADIYEFAQAVSHLPGVARVVIDTVWTIPEPTRELRIR